MADIAEQICLAVDQIVTERLKSINFDHTEVATIIDNTHAANFQYTCSNGSAQYVAYSKDTTFKINDSVQVTIPNNDYTQQKVIIGRYVAKDATPYVFTQPFNTIIDVSTNLFDDNENVIQGNLLANEDYDLAPFNEEFKSYDISRKEIHLWNKVFDGGYKGFNRLGIQGQFRSWISSFKTTNGNYGYRLEVLSSNGDIIEIDENNNNAPTYEDYVKDVASLYSNLLKKTTDESLNEVLVSLPEEWYIKVKDVLKLAATQDGFKNAFIEEYNKAEKYSETQKDMIYALLYANAQITELYLDSSDMFGNPYNYQSFNEEEKVFDISTIGKIMGVFLFFYEDSGSFYNSDKEYIPYYNLLGTIKKKLNSNLFTKDPYICLGYDLSGFKEEQAILYSLDNDTYINKDNVPKEKNQKHIRLRWLHEYDNGEIKVITESSELEDYEIRWYRFQMGHPSADEYSGVYWERVNVPEVVKETIPLDEINKLQTFYLLFHWIPGYIGSRYADEGIYCNANTFTPEYKNVGKIKYSGAFSHMSYWTDECIANYGIPRDLADHAFIGYTTSAITKYVDQTWYDIFKQGFVFHDTKYQGSDYYKDFYTGEQFSTPSGCMHKIGFWEKFTLAYRLYWMYPDQFDLLLPNNFWKKGGINPTSAFDQFGKWSDFSSKNIYEDISYSSDGKLLSDNSGLKFNVSSMTAPFRNLLSLFADSFGEWGYIMDDYGCLDYVPVNESVRNYLFTATENFYKKLDDPTYERVIDQDPFSYLLDPRTNTDSEQVKVIILYNGKVIRSNIITFYSETQAANIATAELLAGLSVWCKDGSYGNYCIYGQNNNLLNESKTNEVLTLEARFADRELLQTSADVDKESPLLTEAKEIQWEFPLNGTMIILHGFNYSYENEIRKAISNNNGEVKRTGINYKECLVDGVLNLSKVHDIDPTGKIFKVDGYYTATDSNGNSSEWISVLGNTIRIIRPAENLNVDPVQQYRIAKTYSASNFNNTVKCTIRRDGLTYSAAKELTFGIMGTNGTDATLVIDFNNNKTALTADWENEAFKVTAHLYDFNHKEVDFNNAGLDLSCEWSWFYYKEFTSAQEIAIKDSAWEAYQQANPDSWSTLKQDEVEKIKADAVIAAATIKITTDPENEPSNVCFINHSEKLDLENKKYFLILQATVKGFGDYDLTAYKAIPIRSSSIFRYIVGPTEIIYNSSGYATYYKDPYQMWWCGSEDNVNEFDMVKDETKMSMVTSTWRIYDPFFETDPKRPDETESRFIGTISERNILQPATIYVKDAKPYGVICYSNVGGAQDSTNLVWIQPLVVLQNEYPSSTLNKWDGKSIKIDEENGTIVSPAIAAGKKNGDNTFSGVMIGSWENTDTASDIAQQTGVYGFHYGQMSYAFKEDGTAFIGKSNRGRIIFDGNEGTLKSANWTDLKKSGMYLDIDDGILKLQKDPGYSEVELDATTYVPGNYYILSGTYIAVPHNTKFGENFEYVENGQIKIYNCNNDTSYYKTAIVPAGTISAEEFNANKSKIYIKTRPTYKTCTSAEKFVMNTIYYKNGYTAVSKDTMSTDKYNKNAHKIYYTKTSDDTYVLAGETFSASTQYYVITYVATKTCVEEFDSNKNNHFYIQKTDDKLGTYYVLAPTNSTDFSQTYYEQKIERAYLSREDLYNKYTSFYSTQVPGYHVKITTTAFSNTETYYKEGYAAEDYGYTSPDKTVWNQFDAGGNSSDPNLKNNEYYYVFLEQFIQANDAFDSSLTYYKNNAENESSARYITLSAAATTYPLSIGTSSSEYERKFKVAWDGTCYIQDGVFSGRIVADEGILGNLEVQGELSLSSYGAISANKSHLLDFNNSGFWLNGQGINIGGSNNYFLATTSFTGFYNSAGGLRISGTGLDLYPNLSAATAYTAFSTGAQGLVHLGWTQGQVSYPYVRFGQGNSEGVSSAGIVKKYGGGMWIGDYGANISGNNPKGDASAKVGLFCCTNSDDLKSETVYRCEYINGTRVFEPARYARFAPG